MDRKEFKIGDKVVCIDNEYEDVNFPFKFERVYEIVSIDNYGKLGLVNDNGHYYEPNWNRFTSNKEWRKLKLEEIQKSLNEQKT